MPRLTPVSYSVFLSPQSVFRIIIKFYFRHSIWEMSSVPDGFLTSPVIEYVRLFPTSFLVSAFFFFFCFSVALPQTTLMYFQFCGFSFAFLFHFLFAFSSRFEGATSVPESQLSYLSPASAPAPVEVFYVFTHKFCSRCFFCRF